MPTIGDRVTETPPTALEAAQNKGENHHTLGNHAPVERVRAESAQ